MIRCIGTCLVLGLWTAGCTAFAPPGDYADYRRVRLADTGYERLVEARHYLEAHPQGWWAPRLRRWRTGVEPVMYERARASPAKLRSYLRAYPEGVHAEQARERLRAISTLAAHRQRHEQRAHRARRATRQRLAERRRQWATRAMRYWLRTFVDLDVGGRRLPEVARRNPAFDRAFGRNPRPRCTRTECVKGYRVSYTVATPGGSQLARAVVLWIRLRVDDGRLRRADLVLPDRGFSRWFELHTGERVSERDAAQRERAITWALERIASWVRHAAPDASRVNVGAHVVRPPQSKIPFASAQRREDAGEKGQGGTGTPDARNARAPGSAKKAHGQGIVGFRTSSRLIGVFAAAATEASSAPAYDGVFVEWRPENGQTDASPADAEETGS